MSGERSGSRRYSWASKVSVSRALTLAILGLVFVAPVIGILQGASAESLVELSADPFIHRVVLNTFLQAGLSTLPAVLASLPIAYFFAKYEFRLSPALRAVLIAPFFAPGFAAAEAFLILYGRRGVVNTLLMELFHFHEPPLNLLYTMEAVVLAHFFYYVPVAFVVLEAGFAGIGQDLVDAARSLGASEWKIFRKVMLPQLVPSLTGAATLVFIFSFLTFATPLLIGGSFTTLEVQIYYYWASFGGWTTARTLSLLQLGLNLVFVLAIFHVRERLLQPRMLGVTAGLRRVRLNLARGGFGVKALAFYASGLVVFEALPLYFIFASGFAQSFYLVFPVGASLQNFQRLFSFDFGTRVTVWDSMGQSVAIATVAALLSVFASLVTAYTILDAKGRPRSFLSATTTAPLAVSHIALGMGLYTLYGTGLLQLYGRWELLALGHLALIYPFTTRLIESALIKLDPDLIEAASAAGASRLYTFLRVELPLIGPSVIAAALMAFASSVGEFTFALMFTTGTLQTMPVSVEMLLDFRQLGLAAAMTSLILVVIFISALLANLLASKSGGGITYGA